MDERIEAFLKEDIGERDITTDAIVPEDHISKAIILTKANGVVAGHLFAREVFEFLDRGIQYHELKQDGERVIKGEKVAVIRGKSRAILTGERVALNILQRLSGIATLTRSFVEAVENTGVKIHLQTVHKTMNEKDVMVKDVIKWIELMNSGST